MEWQPIETYPKHKTVLLTNGSQTIIGYLDDEVWSGGWYGSYAEVMEQIKIEKPTHWMDIPPPPAQQ